MSAAKNSSDRSRPSATIEDHERRGDSQRRVLFKRLRAAVLEAFPDVVENSLPGYIGYGLGLTKNGRLQKTFLQVEVHEADVLVYLRPAKYLNPGLVITTAAEKTGWTLNKLVRLYDPKEVPSAIELVRQSYDDVQGR